MDDTIEKAIAAAVDIVFDDILDLRDQINSIQRTPGPKGEPGEMTPVELVVKYLIEHHPDKIRGERGADGEPGKSATPPSAYEIAREMKSDPEFLRQCKPDINIKHLALALIEHGAEELRGPAGKDAPQITVEDVADALKHDDEFVASSKGEKGDTPDEERLIDLFFQKYGENLRGEPGKDAPLITVDEIAGALKSDDDFIAKSKGDPGEKGEKGDTPDAEVLIDAFYEKYGERVRGEPGKDVDPETLLKKFKDDSEFVASLKGAKGDTGERGQDGAGIEAPQWKKGVFREGVAVQHFMGRYYRAKRDTADEPGFSDDWERVGTSGWRFVGEKQTGADLEDGDVFTVQGSAYIWLNGESHVLAKMGAKGEDGKDGEKGDQGKDAPFPVAAHFSEKGLALALSDGSVIECETENFQSFVETVAHNKAMELFEDERKRIETRGIPVTAFMGHWQESVSYKRGDMVTMSNGLWSCKSATRGRFNPDDWGRVISFPTAGSNKKSKAAPAKKSFQIPAKKAAGTNLRACVDVVAEGELNQYEIQAWNDDDSFLPVIRLSSFDPELLIQSRHVTVESILIQNFTAGVIGTNPHQVASLDDVGFALAADLIPAGAKLLSTVTIDKRNPDFDVLTIESRYRTVSGESMAYTVSAWTGSDSPISFIGFGAADDDESHWRAFHK